MDGHNATPLFPLVRPLLKHVRTSIAALLVSATGVFLAAVVTAHAQEKVTIAELDWNGGIVIAHVIKAIIQGPLDSEAQIIDGLSDQSIILEEMDKGGGAIDVYPDLWLPNRQNLWDKYVDGNKTIATNQPYTGTEQIFVPRYMAKTVKSLQDLATPMVAALFDTNGDGKGEYWAGDPDWNATKVTQIKFKNHGLSELWEPSVVSFLTFKTQFIAAYSAQQPILFYYWTPEWIHSAYDLVALQEPEPFEGCADLKLEQADWLAASSLKCKIADSKAYVAYSRSLEQRNPPVARLLSNIRLDSAMVSDWILKVGHEKQDPQAVAEAWIKANYDTVRTWIKNESQQ